MGVGGGVKLYRDVIVGERVEAGRHVYVVAAYIATLP